MPGSKPGNTAQHRGARCAFASQSVERDEIERLTISAVTLAEVDPHTLKRFACCHGSSPYRLWLHCPASPVSGMAPEQVPSIALL
jgi:hypothetical protein